MKMMILVSVAAAASLVFAASLADRGVEPPPPDNCAELAERYGRAQYELGREAGINAMLRLVIRERETGALYTIEQVRALADSVAGRGVR